MSAATNSTSNAPTNAAMNNDVVIYHQLATKSGHRIGIATLNSEASLNALSVEMVQSLGQQLTAWANDDNVVAVWLQGAGGKAFCAGGDIRKIYEAAKANPGELTEPVEQFFTQEYRLDYQIHRYPKPIVVWGSGIVMGGGLGLMAGAAFRLVTETSRIAMPEITIGLFPDVGGTYFLNRMPGQCGRFLGLTAYNMNGADACYVGLGDYLVNSGDRDVLIERMQQLNWQQHNGHDRELLAQALTQFAQDNAPLQQSVLKLNQGLVDELVGGDDLSEVIAKLTHFETDLSWLQRAIKTALAGSPISAQLVWQQLQLGQQLTLEQVFQQELVWAVRCAQMGDFVEGVRALLIDKDRNPQWRFGDINEVSADTVKQLSASPWQQHPLANIKESAL